MGRDARNIILIGLPGCGKSTLGRWAAGQFGLDFMDMDREIERRAGLTIPEIFAREGEEGFREREVAVARDVARQTRTVIAAGGGVVLREQNMRRLGENGLIVFIDRAPERIVKEVTTDDRPLLAGGADRVFALSAQRRPLYLASAHVTLPNDGDWDQATTRLRALMYSEYPPAGGLAVIGDPIGHTLSPYIHKTALGRLGLDIPYEAIQVPPGSLGAFTSRARTCGLRGFNVTIPHKQDIMPFLDDIDPPAALCGAVNTVVVRGGKLFGYNTDMEGLWRALRGAGHDYRNRRLLILGAGGAARGVAVKAALEGAAKIAILSRRPRQAQALCMHLASIAPEIDCAADDMAPDALTRACRGADLLINATPLGMAGMTGAAGTGAEFPSFAFLTCLPPLALVCDLVYNPHETALLREAGRLGLETMNGLGMLIRQALLSDKLFLRWEEPTT